MEAARVASAPLGWGVKSAGRGAGHALAASARNVAPSSYIVTAKRIFRKTQRYTGEKKNFTTKLPPKEEIGLPHHSFAPPFSFFSSDRDATTPHRNVFEERSLRLAQ